MVGGVLGRRPPGPVLLWTEPDEPVLGAILAPAAADAVAIWEDVRLPG